MTDGSADASRDRSAAMAADAGGGWGGSRSGTGGADSTGRLGRSDGAEQPRSAGRSTPIRPGPTCVPMTGPISETNSGVAAVDLARRAAARRSTTSGAWMCWMTNTSRRSSRRSLQVVDEPLERAPGRAHALDRRDLALDREDRLDLQRRADPRLRRADAPAAAQELERVDREPASSGRARSARAACAAPARSAPPWTALAAAIAMKPVARRSRSRSRSRSMRSAATPRSISASRACSAAPHRAGDAAGQVDRERCRRPRSSSGS